MFILLHFAFYFHTKMSHQFICYNEKCNVILTLLYMYMQYNFFVQYF